MSIKDNPAYKYCVSGTAPCIYSHGDGKLVPCPAPLFPCIKYHQIILNARLRQPGVRLASAQMSILDFIISYFYEVIFSRQTRQPSLQHVAHARAHARGLFFFIILLLYFEFIKKRSDQPDSNNADADVGLTEWPVWSNAGLTRADAIF